MKFTVRVHPGSSQEKLVQNPDSSFTAYLTKRPQKGQANQALIKLLAKHLGLSKSAMTIVQGRKSRLKTIEIYQEK